MGKKKASERKKRGFARHNPKIMCNFAAVLKGILILKQFIIC